MRITVWHNEEMAQVLLNTQSYDDCYSLIKVILLFIATICLFSIFVFKKDIEVKLHKSLLLLIPYIACIFLSVFFSEYRISALFGIVDQFEGALTQLYYCCVLVFFYYLTNKTSNVVTIFKMLGIGSLVVSFIGLLQFTGVMFTERPYEISSTIGNSNYVGTYAVLLLPVAFALILLETHPIKKSLSILLNFGSAWFLLLGSQSKAGYVAFVVIILLFFILMRHELIKQYKWFFVTAIYGVMILVIMNTYSQGVILDEVRSLNPFIQEEQKEKLVFVDVMINGTNAEIKTNKWVLKVEYTEDGFKLYNDDIQDISYEKDSNGAVKYFRQEPYSEIIGYEIKGDGFLWLMLNMEGKDIEFIHVNEKLKVVGYNGKVTDIEKADSFGFTGKESFASGRGYIWSRSIPLLKNALFIGYGPDTFIYIFPQNDIVGKLNYGAIWAIISKPHNWYLQIALGSGVFSLICILALIVWFIIKALMSICKKPIILNEDIYLKYVEKRIITSTVFLCVIGYCVIGIINDSVVAVSPIFWVLLGIGIRLVNTALKMNSND